MVLELFMHLIFLLLELRTKSLITTMITLSTSPFFGFPPLFCGWKINKKPTFILILTAFCHTINTSIPYYGLIMQFVNINEHVLNVHPLGTN
jgi:hypothetical protein